MQCEMCGKETDSLRVVQIEGSKLEVCADCESFGEVLHEEQPSAETESDSGSEGGRKTRSTSSSKRSSGSGGRRRDPFEEIGTLAADYDSRVRDARESMGLTQEELSDRLNEKQSLIRKIEAGDMRPDEEVRSKLERALDVSLTEEVSADDWESDSASEGFTLGDVIERKD
ncbi:MAG: multiprotein bridging factor aMBF1 [Halobacteriales archaeon]